MSVVVGIDLGTSNSAAAVAQGSERSISEVAITQSIRAGAVGEEALLPSALYIPLEGEFAPGTFALPWGEVESQEPIIGVFARDRGALAPDRVVSSAKSWLCTPQVDRRSKILPWKSEIDAAHKVSPFEATVRYLTHLKCAIQHALYIQQSSFDANNDQVVVTVPASFDEVARTLTFQAAQAAGLQQVLLLEEPLAAFYSWLATHEDHWRDFIVPGDLVLVCDVGGGTADFSLIAVSQDNQNLSLERVSVGEHLLLGGDNIDLALAYTARAKLEQDGKSVDQWQFLSLVHQARVAKEELLSQPDIAELPLSIAGRGSSLFAQSLTTTLTQDEVRRVVLDGFFPVTELRDLPKQRASVGLQEFGLAYVTDPAISKHIARFLTRSRQNVISDPNLSRLVGGENAVANQPALLPNKVLFNGGTCMPTIVRERILEIITHWRGDTLIRELPTDDYSRAVAKGAAIYGRLRANGEVFRIKAGLSRSYYIGMESTLPAVPGFNPPMQGVCVAPQGMEEGSEALLQGQHFGLVIGEPVEFRFFSSEIRAGDEPGAVVPNAESMLEESSRLAVELAPGEAGEAGNVVPVVLHAKVTELGMLELFMQHTQSEQRWKIEFNVRAE